MNPTTYAVIWANTTNIGDDIQTLAAINFLKKKNITSYKFVNREEMRDYKGENITLIMNGWFMHNINQFPPADNITPIFISFHVNNELLIKKNIDYFKKYEPIGCRDMHTLQLFNKYNIKAYFTGCLTLFFDEDKKDKNKYIDKNNIMYAVDLDLNHPNIDINYIKTTHCVDKNLELEQRLVLAQSLLDKYKHAKLVITKRLHCVLPCRAFNTDVIFVDKHYTKDCRFVGLEKFINGYTIIPNNLSIDPVLKLNLELELEEVRAFYRFFAL